MTVVTVYRVAGADDPEPMFKLIDLIADRELDAVTFTSAPAVAALMDAAGPTGRRDDVIARLPGRRGRVLRRPGDRGGVRAVGRADGLPRPVPAGRDGQAARDRAALAPQRPDAWSSPAASCCSCTATTSSSTASRSSCRRRLLPCCRRWSPTPATWSPGGPCSAMLPSGTAGSEHAVEMAVARLRAALGTRAVQTVVKRGYRLAVATA